MQILSSGFRALQKTAAGKIEFAVWAEDAAKVNRVLEKMGVDYLQADTGAKAEVGPMPVARKVRTDSFLHPSA
ncbi:hypothetical protein NE475_20260, partial [Ruthenibacterium lactatiformans]|nr:hypothetical protein [Ruthenibacterium lactatiformans]